MSKRLHHPNYLSFIFSCESHRTLWHSCSEPRMFHCRAMRIHFQRNTKQQMFEARSKFSREKNDFLHGIYRLWKKGNQDTQLVRSIPYHKWEDTFSIFFFLYKFIYFNCKLITLQFCIGFAIHQHESTTVYTCSPSRTPPSTSLPIPSLCIIPVHQAQASSIMHRTWTGDSFHI